MRWGGEIAGEVVSPVVASSRVHSFQGSIDGMSFVGSDASC